MHGCLITFGVIYKWHQSKREGEGKATLSLFCQIISVECPTNVNFPLLTSNQNKGSPKQPISMKCGSKFVGHSTEIIRQSKIKGPLRLLSQRRQPLAKFLTNELLFKFTLNYMCSLWKNWWENDFQKGKKLWTLPTYK